ncbi:MAG: trigger factor [Flavobacteriales bacterium]|nr:trigger factor [Candidatus Arcticimaribacter sp.]
MQITRKDLDALNSTLTITLEQNDFAEKVLKVLNDYRKNANIPGFRKGHVPMGMIKKQYETPVTADEVNKILQENLNKYINDEKLELLGNPLPKTQEEINWKADTLNFDFELGLSPKFEVKLKGKKAVTHFQIEADKKMIDEQLSHIKKQYGKLKSSVEITKGTELSVEIKNEESAIDTKPIIEFDQIKGKKNIENFSEAKIGDVLELKTKNLFTEESAAARAFGVTVAQLGELPKSVTLNIKEVNKRILADLDQELFDKLYEAGTVTSVTELKAKVKEGIEKQFESQSEQKLLNDITESLIKNTKFDLPKEFLIKWLQNSGEKPLTDEEAREEYEKSEKGIRYQLIEGSIVKEQNLQIQFKELQNFAKDLIKQQMAQYGQMAPEEKELDDIAARIFKNQEETKRLSDQLMSKKLLGYFKENAGIKTKKVNYTAFVKEAYGSTQ